MNIPSLNILHFQFCVIKIGSWPLFLNNLVHTMKILHFLQTVVLKGGESQFFGTNYWLLWRGV